MRIWAINNREESRKKAREQYAKLKADKDKWELSRITRRAYNKKNSEQIQARHRAYQIAYRKRDINARITHNLRTRLWSAFNKQKAQKSGYTQELIGCTIPELRNYLEKKFKDGISWNNYGKWHIDHIKPCSKFDLTNKDEQKKAFHYTNLQPLWAIDNLKKGKYD